ncbi:pyruvate carboxylase subunit B [Puniceicoccales bacterium CK1056]|uniref:Pyruvate carboxylase subunit B n=1 Tax=Oceanipulchritudo coccoides TaxID=2706888 RepID=A0A6B2LWQ8_9BACT|nr:pyruvate carboxylase subunit B [Oceanipulchritudo coccoides]NDV60851.1 pyruvate carboxylase subunit B [Oceanipulchritudo coccoides]
MAKQVIFNNMVLRDGHQSLAATRMSTEQMLPVLKQLDSLGFGALETWGGATIDAGLRFLDEFPFDRLDKLKAGTPNTPHMMLLRGQNIVQYANFPDDVVEAFVKMSAKHGMDIFRIFDALNDTRNIKTAVKAVKAAGKHAQGVMCYTTSPVHSIESFLKMGEELEAMGCDSICVKDMAGLIPPVFAYKLVKGLKDRCKIPVNVHTHETAGLGASTYYAAIEAGADMVDTSITPFANGTGQPDTVRMLSLLEDHPRKPEYDIKTLQDLSVHFKKVYAELDKFTAHKNEVVDSEALIYQVPGGMLSNFRNQLKEQKMEDRFEDVFAEIPVVRKALGWIPLVTPTSQIVGVQAMLNVKFGRWKNFSPQAMDIALGYYGQTPAPVDPEVRKIAAEKSGKDPIDCRPADLIEPRMDKLREELKKEGLPSDDEHCVIWAMFPQELKKHYENKSKPAAAPAPKQEVKAAPAAPAAPMAESAPVPAGSRKVQLSINGHDYTAIVEEVVSE